MTSPKMFVPSNFTVGKNLKLDMKDCRLIMYDEKECTVVNLFKNHFEGDLKYEGWDIYTQDEPVVFIDKLEFYTNNEERMIV